ncbi:MAG: hypothetical protein HON90_00980 [Halobacteriovoraceae bacterium]|nr:hypothetical protein [Halobacteriovoraceae bacterium]
MATWTLSYRGDLAPLPTSQNAILTFKKENGSLVQIKLPWKISQKKRQGLISHHCSPQSRFKVPKGADIVKDVPFTAYSFQTKKGKIGLIRIPHYFPADNATGNDLLVEWFNHYKSTLEKFEKETVGLIIDQDFNCGGSIVYLLKIIALLMDKPFEAPSFEFRASKDQINGMQNYVSEFQTNTPAYLRFTSIIHGIKVAYNNNQFSTQKIPFRGFFEHKLLLKGDDLIEPETNHYTKPIVITINEMSGSGGDVFPALLKSYGRATLAGMKTMGAGGHLWNDPHLELKNSKISVHLTRSLIYRPHGATIENNGANPDIFLSESKIDLKNGYSNYFNQVIKSLLIQIN